jgi:hypothetical protein
MFESRLLVLAKRRQLKHVSLMSQNNRDDLVFISRGEDEVVHCCIYGTF